MVLNTALQTRSSTKLHVIRIIPFQFQIFDTSSDTEYFFLSNNWLKSCDRGRELEKFTDGILAITMTQTETINGLMISVKLFLLF